MSKLYCVNEKRKCVIESSVDSDNKSKLVQEVNEKDKINQFYHSCYNYDGVVLKTKPEYYEQSCNIITPYSYTNDKDLRINLKHFNMCKELIKKDNVLGLKDYLHNNFRKEIDKENFLKKQFGKRNNTLFHEAVYWNSSNCMAFFKNSNNFEYSLKNSDGNTILNLACLLGNYWLALEIIKCDNNEFFTINKKGEIPFHSAIRSGSLDLVHNLFEQSNGSVLFSKNDLGRNSLHIAVLCPKKNIKIIRFLINAGDDPINTDKNNKTIMLNLKEQPKTELNAEIETLLIHTVFKLFNGGKDKEYDTNLCIEEFQNSTNTTVSPANTTESSVNTTESGLNTTVSTKNTTEINPNTTTSAFPNISTDNIDTPDNCNRKRFPKDIPDEISDKNYSDHYLDIILKYKEYAPFKLVSDKQLDETNVYNRETYKKEYDKLKRLIENIDYNSDIPNDMLYNKKKLPKKILPKNLKPLIESNKNKEKCNNFKAAVEPFFVNNNHNMKKLQLLDNKKYCILLSLTLFIIFIIVFN